MAAVVVRTEGGSADKFSIAVAFRDLSAETENFIQEEVLAELKRTRSLVPPTILVLDENPGDRDALGRDLEALGHRVLLASMPLDALRWLHDQHVHVEIAFVDRSLERANCLEMLAFLADDSPDVRRVLMCPTAEVPADLAASAHAILLKPWRRELLINALAHAVRTPHDEI
jgi:CheY-like chemotaxis protein